MNIKKLDKNYKRQIAEIASNCFIDDPYFDYLSQDKTIKKEKLIKIYETGVDITLRHGDIFGAFNNDKLAGFVMIPNYNSLKNNSQDYNKIFSLSSTDYNSDIIQFINYANALKNPQYLLAICVNPNYQKQGIGYNLVKHIVQVYKDQEIISDVDNKNSLSIYKKLDFNIKQLSEKFYYVNKNNSTKLIEVNENNKELAL